MATLADTAPRAAPWEALAGRWGLAAVLVATLAVRIGAAVALRQPLASDGLSYFTLAQSLANGGIPTDNFGNHAFFSPGYPIVLAPAFALFGASVPVALAVNLLLAAGSAALVWRLAGALGGSAVARALAGVGYALWLPGIWGATELARENLSVPLLLGFVLALLAIRERPVRGAALAGLCWAAGVLAGTSVLFTILGFAVALIQWWRASRPLGASIAAFALGAALVLTPWLATTSAIYGRPVLTTSGGFNLYIGNNPLATGRFVSMRYLPLGGVWHERYAELGERGASAWLGAEATAYVEAHPLRTATMGAEKLALFWAPNWPDAGDLSTARAVAVARLIEVAQYLLVVALAIAAFWRRRIDAAARWPLAATIGGFWLIHAATYIIPRYRDPAMPLLIACAALTVAGWLRRDHAR